MSPNQVYGVFKEVFPQYITDDLIFFPNGRNSIRVRGIEGFGFRGYDFVFTYHGHDDWIFETLASYMKRSMKTRSESDE